MKLTRRKKLTERDKIGICALIKPSATDDISSPKYPRRAIGPPNNVKPSLSETPKTSSHRGLPIDEPTVASGPLPEQKSAALQHVLIQPVRVSKVDCGGIDTGI